MTTTAIMDSPVWVPAAGYHPYFAQVMGYIAKLDRFGHNLLQQLRVDGASFFVGVLGPDDTTISSPTGIASGRALPYLFAVPFVVTPEVCDASGVMATGALTAFMDMITAVHLNMARLPEQGAHASINFNATHVRPLLKGQSYVAISRLDKLGRRVVYMCVDYVERMLPSAQPMETMAALRAALQHAAVCVSVKHIQALIPPPGAKESGGDQATKKEVAAG